MKVLHVDSSILGEQSVSRKLSAAVVARLQDQAPDLLLRYRDLGSDPLPHLSGGYLMAAQAQSGDTDAGLRHDLAESEAALSEFLEAEVVVIGSPMYNYTISSQLKAWIDRLAVAGRTFRYTEDGPQGLARGKRIVATLSRGGFYGGETQAAAEHQEGYLRAIFGMFGIDDFVFIKAEGTAVSTEAREAAVADALLKIASADLAPRIGGQAASI